MVFFAVNVIFASEVMVNFKLKRTLQISGRGDGLLRGSAKRGRIRR
jgi:hypothetical protein